MGYDGKLSNYHEHSDGTSGWDINIKSKDGYGKTVHKMHIEDRSNVNNEKVESILVGIAKTAASVFEILLGKK